MNVGELRDALAGYPDDTEVHVLAIGGHLGRQTEVAAVRRGVTHQRGNLLVVPRSKVALLFHPKRRPPKSFPE